MCFFKNHAENDSERLVRGLFFFFFLKKKELYMKQKQVVSTLVSIYFGNHWLWHTIKTNCMKLQTVDPEMDQFRFLKKWSGTNFSTIFCVCFFKRNISHMIFYQLTKFHCMAAFTSWDIWQYVYCNWLLSSHKF